MLEEYFSWWNLPFDFLFSSWKVSTTVAMVFTALCIFCVAYFYESLRVFIAYVNKSFCSFPLVVVPSEKIDVDLANSIVITDSLNYVRKQRIKKHCLQTFVHMIKVLLGYVLMLSIMTYNGYIAIALLCGAVLGYFTFAHKEDFKSVLQQRTSSAASTVTSQTSEITNELVQPLNAAVGSSVA